MLGLFGGVGAAALLAACGGTGDVLEGAGVYLWHCDRDGNDSLYSESVASLAGDMVFGGDGGIHQLATMSGDADSGYVAALTIGG